jgi:hypothetical protein
MLIALPVWGATYYVNSASSGGDGTTTATSGATAAFATVAAAQAALTGDQSDNFLLFNKGQTWEESFTLGAYGTAGHPFTIGAYGTGARPIIDGGDSRDFCIFTNGKSYLTFTGLHVKRSVTYSNFFVWYNVGFSNITIDDCVSELSAKSGITVSNAHASEKTTNIVISNSTFTANAQSGIDIGSKTNTVTISGNTVYGNTTSAAAAYHAGIHVFGDQADGAGIVIENNHVYSNVKSSATLWANGNGIHVDEVAGTPGPIIRYNHVHNNGQVGIFVEHVRTSPQVYYNLSYANDPTGTLSGVGILVYRGVTGATVYNNTCYGNNVGIGAIGEATGDTYTNNLFKNNIATGSTARALWASSGGENDGTRGSGNVYTNNAFGPEAADFITWGAATPDTYDAWETAYGGTTASVEADPQFVSTSNFYLRAGSPAINAGANVSLTSDFSGNGLVGAPDIGAYEFASQRGMVITGGAFQ